ncbi:Trm112 family protein [Commensalibacter oyaizuii]|uniref:UPF0434 protein QJV27_10775 n=1 Tax=Commensalibacter oyaizuii TaxID=3043873 RepID=A0ABT6Q404_9PROT|nr:Trm112 family protein [Commensalibacter sp. TBRC 16381]MDI2091846.1 Trm112 family protein [Commensalibacter sp. TBRC 16381]
MTNSSAPIDQRLLSVLVCPVTKGPLIYDREANELISCDAALAYPVKEGIPIMIAQEARQLSEEDVLRFKKGTV